jgi:hypothetical protein
MDLELCSPLIVYIIFVLVYITSQLYDRDYSQAAMTLLTGVFVSVVLTVLCEHDLQTVAWFIVFIPFIIMTIMGFTVITAMAYKYNLFGRMPVYDVDINANPTKPNQNTLKAT